MQNRSKKTLLLRQSSQQVEQPQGTHYPSKWHHLLQTTFGKRKEHKDGPFHGLIRWSLANMIWFVSPTGMKQVWIKPPGCRERRLNSVANSRVYDFNHFRTGWLGVTDCDQHQLRPNQRSSGVDISVIFNVCKVFISVYILICSELFFTFRSQHHFILHFRVYCYG